MNEIDALQAARVAHHLVLAALIQTHPRFEDFQLLLTSSLEKQLATGALGDTLTEDQRQYVRDMVEWTQTIRQATVSPPLRLPPRQTP